MYVKNIIKCVELLLCGSSVVEAGGDGLECCDNIS